jgi:hypothetical protein
MADCANCNLKASLKPHFLSFWNFNIKHIEFRALEYSRPTVYWNVIFYKFMLGVLQI